MSNQDIYNNAQATSEDDQRGRTKPASQPPPQEITTVSPPSNSPQGGEDGDEMSSLASPQPVLNEVEGGIEGGREPNYLTHLPCPPALLPPRPSAPSHQSLPCSPVPPLPCPPAPLLKYLILVLLPLSLSLLPPPPPARAQEPVEFTEVWFDDVADWTMSVAWGDMDGDGDLDLAVGNSGVNRLYRNEGGGNFQEIQDALGTVTDYTTSVAWGDMDGDGDLDLALGNSGQMNRLYRNEGGGSFQELTGTLGTAANNTFSVAWGDMDGDGDLDLALGNYGQVNQLYRNEGGGFFQELTGALGTASDTTRSVAWGDMDGDGDLDLAVGNGGPSGGPYQVNRLYRNEGGESFQEMTAALGPATDNTRSVAWGDMDGDGDLDLALGNDGQANRLYRNERGGSFQEMAGALGPATNETYGLAWGDMDGDGDLDLALGNWFQANHLYRNEGGGSFSELPGALGPAADSTYSVAWGDMDGDGDLDLALGNNGRVNRLYRNEGGGSLTEMAGTLDPTTGSTTSVAWGDMDGDGDLDLALGNDGQANQLYRNERGGSLTDMAGAIGTAANNTYSVAWGDMDGDGDLDLAVGNDGQMNRLYRNEGGSSFQELNGALGPAADSTRSVAWGDMDGDGDLDLALGNDGQVNRLYRNEEEDSFQELTGALGPVTDATRSVAWGDMDGDGDLDLALGNNYEVNRVYRNEGEGSFQEIEDALGPASDATRSVAWGDMDGDGDLDLALGNAWQANQLYRNEKGGSLTDMAGVLGPATDSTQSMAWGDMDGDGDLDLVVGNSNNQANRLYRNEGEGSLIELPGAFGSAADATWSLAWGDMDGDGDLDLAVGNSGTVNQLYQNRRQGEQTLPNNAPSLKVTAPYTATANFYASPQILAGPTIPLTYTLFDPEGDLVRLIRAEYSPSGGGQWLTATATAATITQNLTTGHTLRRATPHTALPLSLADGGTVSSTLFISDTETMADLDLWLNITHTLNADLEASLVSPTGLTVTLFSSGSLTGTNLTGTVFDDQAATPIISGTAPYTGRHRALAPLANLNGQSSFGEWALRLSDASGGGTGELIAWGLTLDTPPVEHLFTWQAEADLIKNDNIAFRMVAYPGFDSPGPYLRPYASAQTFSFRVEAAEWYVKVVSGTQSISGTQPISGALVYQNGQLITKTVGNSYLTDRAGLGSVNSPTPGQPLVALLQTQQQTTTRAAHDGWAYRTYITSLNLDNTGIPSPTLISQPGEQRVTIRLDDPLVLFNIVVSVEWDAAPEYLTTLEDAFHKASDYLYDVADGQMAFGQVNIYDNAEYWSDADFQFSTKNTVRPYAFLGGITSGDEAHTIRVGRFWDGGSGNSGDWNEPNGYRTLIHEFGHYALYLHDEYFFRLVDGNGNFIGQVDAFCTDEDVTDPTKTISATNASLMFYQYNASELADKSHNWSENCEYTEQCRLNNGESDWETLLRYYDGSAWTINTPSSRDNVMAGPTEFPTQLLPFPQVITRNIGVAGGPSLQVTVQDPQDQPVHNALVALYTTDKNGINIAIDQGLTDQQGQIDVYGAVDGDTIKAATFDAALSGGVRVFDAITSYQLTLSPTNVSGLSVLAGPTTPYLNLIPSSDGDSLTLSVRDALPSSLPLMAMVIPGEGAGTPQFAPLTYSPSTGSYDGVVSFAGVGLGTGRVQVNGLAGGQVVAINSDYSLQAVQAITTNHLYSEDGNFELHIPPGGVPANGYSTVIPTGYVPAPLPPGKQVIGSAYEIRLSGALITTTKESLVRLHYHPEVMGVFTNTAIYYWDAGNEVWQNQGGEEGEVDNALVITTTRLGIYALMGAPGGGAEVYLPIIVKEE